MRNNGATFVFTSVYGLIVHPVDEPPANSPQLSRLFWPDRVGAVPAAAPHLLHGALHVAEDTATQARVQTSGQAVQRNWCDAHEV
jgi:hypothetical protein